jgi:hypothetical protein
VQGVYPVIISKACGALATMKGHTSNLQWCGSHMQKPGLRAVFRLGTPDSRVACLETTQAGFQELPWLGNLILSQSIRRAYTCIVGPLGYLTSGFTLHCCIVLHIAHFLVFSSRLGRRVPRHTLTLTFHPPPHYLTQLPTLVHSLHNESQLSSIKGVFSASLFSGLH